MTQSNVTIGGFRILAEIHGGGQGKVVKAVCETPPFDGIEPGTVVALKVMPVFHDEGGRRWTRLQERTNALSKLSHPNVVKYYGCFREKSAISENHVIVMECLDGETLRQRLARFPRGLDADEALRITEAAIAGLEYAAANGIVHRDVKPSNIFLCTDGGVKLIDFELAFLAEGSTESPDSTATRKLVGTYDYMAPEFVEVGFGGDERSDVFSMGVVMHEAITGRTPYPRTEGGDRQSNFSFFARWACLKTDGANPIKISTHANLLLPRSREVLAKALAPLPQDRYQTFAEFHEGLKSIRFRELLDGEKVYRILQIVGKGGFGEVFKARHVASGNIVAIKHLRHPGSKVASFVYGLKRLPEDSAIVKVVDHLRLNVGGDGEEQFIAMEYLPERSGIRSLRDAIRAARLSRNGTLPMADVFCAFMRYAHGLEILHRHHFLCKVIRPSSLYYDGENPNNVKIMDFNWPSEGWTGNPCLSDIDYLPPEVVLTANRGGPEMDIYALGLSLYEALTGKTAYPRLPLATAGFRKFVERSRNMEQPSFDSTIVTSRPKLLQLLKDMTNIDPAQRITGAAEVERRIGEIIKEDFAISDDPIELDEDLLTVNEPVSVVADPPVCDARLVEAWRETRRRKRRKVVASLLAGLLIATACCTLFWYGRSNSFGYRVLVDVLAVVWLFLLCTMELKTKRLPNGLTLGGLALWLALGFASESAAGLLACGKAAGIGFLFLLVPFLMKSVGGGLVKMIAACCAYVGWGRLLPFGVLYVVSGMIMGGSVWMDRFANRVTDKKGTNIPGSPILAVATLAVIVFKWIGWVA